MSAAIFPNDTFHLAQLTQQQAASLNNSSDCTLPALHSHATLQTPGQLWAQFNEQDDVDEPALIQQIDRHDDNHRASLYVSETIDQQAGKLQAHLDPYIDAVQVRGRVNNKRGSRVQLASAQSHQQLNNKIITTSSIKSDHKPDSSYYSKSVHVEQTGGHSKGPVVHHHYEETYEHSDYEDSDDSDSDDELDDGYGEHEHKHAVHQHHSKHGSGKYHLIKTHKRKKKKRPKKIYLKVHKSGGGGKHNHKHGHGMKKKRKRRRRKKKKHYHGHEYAKKHYDHDKKHHYDQHDEHAKKIIYLKYKEPGKYYEHEHYHGHDHNKYKDSHYHGHKHGHEEKTIHLSVKGHQQPQHHYKGKMSLAGLLGQTLLCVNYLLVLKQPTYDKYASNGYSKYAPHHEHGETLELKSHGHPIILAHCGELPEQRGLVHLRRLKRAAVDELVLQGNNSTSGVKNSTSSKQPAWPTKRLLETAEQQARVIYETGRPLAAAAPPSFYYTLAPSSSLIGRRQSSDGDDDYYQRSSGGGGLLSNLMNRLFLFPTRQQTIEGDDGGLDQIAPQQVRISSPRRGRLRVQQQDDLPFENLNQRGRPLAPVVAARVRTASPNARVVLVSNRPEVVQTRDNLVELRTRPVEIRLRVTSGRRSILGLPQRALRLSLPLNGPASERDAMRMGLAVRPPAELQQQQMQSDQPPEAADFNDSARESNSTGANQQLLDLPEFALSGDSIELTCNHRLPSSRLYSVRWFRDAQEFYRFVPGNLAPKSALSLPDLQLDLARSNANSLYLRNVSHLTSGLFRCEATAEAPGFELLAGERKLAIYALPETGPRLNLVERPGEGDELALLAIRNGRGPLLLSGGPGVVSNQIIDIRNQQPQLINNANGLLRNSIRANQNAQSFNSLELNDDDGESDDEFSSGDLLNGRRLQQQQQRDPLESGGPIVRCASDRSRPVAQLRLFVNGRQVNSARTLENATMSYSDGLESNVISFRVQLEDFLIDEEFARSLERPASNALDREASSKAPSDKAKNATSAATSTTTTSTTTTTTTTTTKRPKLKSEVREKNKKKKMVVKEEDKDADKRKKKDEKKMKHKTETSAKSANPNAQVQFDDHADDHKKPPATNKRKEKNKSWRGNGEAPPPAFMKMLQNDHFGPLNADADGEPATQLPVVRDNSRQADAVVTPIGLEAAHANQLALGGANRTSSDLARDNGGQATVLSSSHASETKVDERRLERAEQRRTAITSRRGGAAGGADQREREQPDQQQRRRQQPTIGAPGVYSNFIRVKCVSMVPALGYEMISELSVPLSLLVPASQLSAALRGQPQLVNGQPAGGALERQAQGRDQDELPAQNGNTNARPGSLQAPRAVFVDRVAQASGQSPASFQQAQNNNTANERQSQRSRRRENETKSSTPTRWIGSSRMSGAIQASANRTARTGFVASSAGKRLEPTRISLLALGPLLVGLLIVIA